MTKTKPLTSLQKNLAQSYLAIDPTSPSGVRWTGHSNRQTASKVTGLPFGSRGARYWQGTLGGRIVQVHNIVWLLAHGQDTAELFPVTVDHIDRNGFNNSVENLRLASRKEQAANRLNDGKPGIPYPKAPVGKSGRRWVTVKKQDGRPARYEGAFSYHNRLVYCGTFTTIDEAYQAVLEKRATLGLSTPKEDHLGQ